MRNRMVRVSELLKREIGDVILRDFETGGMLATVNAVDVAPDLRNALVHIGMVGGKPQAQEAFVEKLNKKRGPIQKRLYSRVTLKYSPQLSFRIDHSTERGVNVVALIDSLDGEEKSEETPS